jgi:hypothetical protein
LWIKSKSKRRNHNETHLDYAACFLCGVWPDDAAYGFAAESTPPLGCSDSGTPTDLSDAGITPLSGFEGGGAEYFTRIRLTAADRGGNPIAGAVYGIYRMADDSLAETLTTDYNGVAVSSELSVASDYYLQEIFAPEGLPPQ